jgi:hypothetical protein
MAPGERYQRLRRLTNKLLSRSVLGPSTLVLAISAALGGAAAVWTNTLSLVATHYVSFAGIVFGGVATLVDLLDKKQAFGTGAGDVIKRIFLHKGSRLASFAICLAANIILWSNTRYARHVQFDCERPLPEGFLLRVGNRNATAACDGSLTWVDERVPIEATAVGCETQTFGSIDQVPRNATGMAGIVVKRRPWLCTIRDIVPEDPRRCNQQETLTWHSAAAMQLMLVGDGRTSTSNLRFSLQSRDAHRFGVGVAGVRGCVAGPETDPAVAELEATPQCVRLRDDGKKELAILAFVCSADSKMPTSFASAAALFATSADTGAKLEVPCDK